MFSYICALVAIATLQIYAAARNWDYEPLSVTCTSADESMIKVDLGVERISRGEFALTGTFYWNYDVSDDTTIEVLAYRSQTGGKDDYKILPWSIPKQKFYEFLNSFYKDSFHSNIANCSNFPYVDGETQPPSFPKQNYFFKRCVLSGEGFPEYAPEGFYKVIGTWGGEVDWTLELIAKIRTVMM